MKSLILPALFIFSLPAFAAEELAIVARHSAVIFQWNHFGYSNPAARFEKLEGKLILDEKDLAKSSVTVKMPLDGLRTGVEALDEHLKTEEFLDAAKYPDISFTSTGIEKGPMDSLKIAGKLVVHGVSKDVVLNGKINKISVDPVTKKSRAGFDAEAMVRRSDFGVGKFVPSVADELHVRITLGAGG
ncbi:polyisoprenoid-binding protein [Massilia sp. Root418]|uniref:YceI family protein n=1 Tax=Massilia sp. Root418 TaxID=1736532 RepID=UPI0006FCE008|nr:YceI family protein [Massilia sp. Root418]KQW93999.1 polyisoprenoid-binding protein [Massilia sp. Root418]